MKTNLFRHLVTSALAITTVIGTAGAADFKQAPQRLVVYPQVALDVAIGTPLMEADRKSKAYIKVSLTGFERDQSGPRPAANVAIVLDRSGSMSGEKLRRARDAAIVAVNSLSSNDMVSLVTYGSDVEVLVPATRLTDKEQVISKIRQISTRGMTALFAGVSKGADELQKFIAKENVNRIILLSDGQANIGPASPAELGKLGASLGNQGISVTTIGLGLGYNEDLMTKLADFSDGNHAFVRKASDLAQIFEAEFGDLMSVVAQDVAINIQCKEGVRPIRILGRNGDIVGQQVSTRISNVHSGQEKFLVLEVEIAADKAGNARDVVEVTVNYKNLTSNKSDKLASAAAVKFVESKVAVTNAQNNSVLTSATEQIANELNQEVIRLRDEGKQQEAKAVLKGNIQYLNRYAKELKAPKLAKQAVEAEKDLKELDDKKNWRAQRKDIKDRSYRRTKQQTY